MNHMSYRCSYLLIWCLSPNAIYDIPLDVSLKQVMEVDYEETIHVTSNISPPDPSHEVQKKLGNLQHGKQIQICHE